MKNPFKNKFDIARNVKQASNVIFVISSTLMIVEFLCSLYESYACIVSVIIPLNCILIILYHVGEIVFDFVLAFAEKAKRKDLFDNAFGTKLAVKNSEGYYTNTGLPPGVYKLGVNNYESCFFTYRILKNDLWQNVTRVIIISILFLLVAFIPDKSWLVLLIQLSLPLVIFQESIRYLVTLSSLNSILDDYWKLFEKASEIREADLLYSISNYTSTLAIGRIILSESTYNKLNQKLSIEWSEIKNNLNI